MILCAISAHRPNSLRFLSIISSMPPRYCSISLTLSAPLDPSVREYCFGHGSRAERHDRLFLFHDEDIVKACLARLCGPHVFQIAGHIFLPVKVVGNKAHRASAFEAMRIISSDSSCVPPATTVPSASIFRRDARFTASACTVRRIRAELLDLLDGLGHIRRGLLRGGPV